MSYLLITTILLTFLFLWSRLPGVRLQTTKRYPDQVTEPDENGQIKVAVPLGTDIPVIPGYVPKRIYVEHLAHPPRIVIYSPVQ